MQEERRQLEALKLSASEAEVRHQAAQRGVESLRAEAASDRERAREELQVRLLPFMWGLWAGGAACPAEAQPHARWLKRTPTGRQQAAARARQAAEDELSAAARRHADVAHTAAQAARAEVQRSAAADLAGMKATAAEALARERAAFQEEAAALRKQLLSERTTLEVTDRPRLPAPFQPETVEAPAAEVSVAAPLFPL